jgi:immunity protein 50 of polymorphic toxin system
MLPKISGVEEIVSWYGEWPSFHDAEILELHLERTGRCWLKIYTVWNKQAVVTFKMEEVTDLELADFSHQNVIGGLELEETPTGTRLIMTPCYGLAGYLEAKRMSVELSPGKLS